jgi:hypothetical protein
MIEANVPFANENEITPISIIRSQKYISKRFVAEMSP